MLTTNDAYLVGLFDGEGCVTTCTNGVGRSYVHAGVSICSEPVVRAFEQRFGGTCRARPTPTAGGLTLWDWRITGAAAVEILELIAEHSLTKAAQAELALKMIGLTRTGGGRGSYVLSGELAARREHLSDQIRALNGARNRFEAVA